MEINSIAMVLMSHLVLGMPGASSSSDFFSPRMTRFRNICKTPPSIHGGIFIVDSPATTTKMCHSGAVHASPTSSPIDMEDSSTRSFAPPLRPARLTLFLELGGSISLGLTLGGSISGGSPLCLH
eukprot:Gb_03894 [translate_table: standard]